MTEGTKTFKVFDDEIGNGAVYEAELADDKEETEPSGGESGEGGIDESDIVSPETVERIGETGIGVIMLPKPVTVDGVKMDGLRFDFNRLSWMKYNQIVKKVERAKKVNFSPTQAYQDRDVLLLLLSEATGILKADLETAFSARTISRGCEMASLFFAK